MIIPNLTLPQAIEGIEKCLTARHDPSAFEDVHMILEPYEGITDEKLHEEIKFLKQLQLGWIKLDRLKVDQQQMLDVYNDAHFGPTGNGDYRDIQGYAYSRCPQFVQDAFAVKLWASTGFLRCMPGKTVSRHKDMGRVAGILIPCIGDQDSIPLTFWDDDGKKISEVILDKPTLINTTVQHSVDTPSQKERTNFNLCFMYPLTFEALADILVRKGGIKQI